MEDFMNGLATAENLPEYIHYAFTNTENTDIREVLGMTDFEYDMWLKGNENVLLKIAQNREQNGFRA